MPTPCTHREDEWTTTTSAGIAVCGRCGTQRFVDYRALGPAIGLPEGIPRGATSTGSGTLRPSAPGRQPATASYRLNPASASISTAAIRVIRASGTRFIRVRPPTMPRPATDHRARTAPTPTETGSS